MNCPSGKVRFRDEIGARIALGLIRKKREAREKHERAWYRCNQCSGWHLTSKGARS